MAVAAFGNALIDFMALEDGAVPEKGAQEK